MHPSPAFRANSREAYEAMIAFAQELDAGGNLPLARLMRSRGK